MHVHRVQERWFLAWMGHLRRKVRLATGADLTQRRRYRSCTAVHAVAISHTLPCKSGMRSHTLPCKSGMREMSCHTVQGSLLWSGRCPRDAAPGESPMADARISVHPETDEAQPAQQDRGELLAGSFHNDSWCHWALPSNNSLRHSI